MHVLPFHPATVAWFERALGPPTEPQAQAWPAIQSGRHTLIAAPTGSGKTLAAFLVAIDGLVQRALDEDGLPDETSVLYISPLKALGNDIHKNLQEPLAGIRAELAEQGLPDPGIRTAVRTGDTPSSERQAMVRRPPHLFVTTPESLFILLTSEGGRKMLGNVRTVIVDEIHAVIGDKRGAHLALSLERLEALTGRPLQRIGLSATQKPIETVARFLVGDRNTECTVIDTGHKRRLDLALEIPPSPLETLMSTEGWTEIYDRLAALSRAHRTTLVFVNTRRMAERVARHLSERLGDDAVAAHHGSLSKERRLEAEKRLKAGSLPVLVATASLELGIDIGAVDLVCQIGSPRSVSGLLQRVGRAGHQVGAVPKGRLFPLDRDDLVECAALLDAVHRSELDILAFPEAPLDILAQQIVAMVARDTWETDALFATVRRAWPYRSLERADFDAVVRMLTEGFTTRRGRRGAYVHHDAVNGRLKGRRGAALAAQTAGGAIPDTADFPVVLEPSGTVVGSVNEDFAIESLAGDIFQLGNTSWRILRVQDGQVRVADAEGEPPSIPFWLGEAPARTDAASEAVCRLREALEEAAGPAADRTTETDDPDAPTRQPYSLGLPAAIARLTEIPGVDAEAARQIAEYLLAGRAALGVLPTKQVLVAERFFDQVGDTHLVLHSPRGARVNRALGLALRKRFCRSFNFELQAAASEDAVVLSLGPTHSFPLEDVFRFLNSKTAREVLTQALLDAPMFGTRWRWNASRSLAILRSRAGKRTPPQLQRMQAEDLLAVVFPDQLACAENLKGEREIPDHPLVKETLRDCLEEVMDVDGLEALLRGIEDGSVKTVARDLREPSPLSTAILRARPYAFLDDAPAEERRTLAVQSRRFLSPEDAGGLCDLDIAAIDRVRDDAFPRARDADELHDALVVHGMLTDEEITAVAEGDGGRLIHELAQACRAARVLRDDGQPILWVAAERLHHIHAAFPSARLDPPIDPPPGWSARPPSPDEAYAELVRGRLEMSGPITADALCRTLGLPTDRVAAALAALEAEGAIFRGRFTPGTAETEWCERRLLQRIHRTTLDRLRREIAPVDTQTFLRFLIAWQGVSTSDRSEGPGGLEALLSRLEGFEAPAAAWEASILPARMNAYDPAWLDGLCVSGRLAWGRRMPSMAGAGPVRTASIMLVPRRHLRLWRTLPGTRPAADAADLPSRVATDLPSRVAAVVRHLAEQGPSFFDDLLAATPMLAAECEAALADAVALGLVTADGFAGVRRLTARPPRDGRRRSRKRRVGRGLDQAGRWSLLPAPSLGNLASPASPAGPANAVAAGPTHERWDEDVVAHIARVLLNRWGVVFRALLERESGLPPWRTLLRVYRRLEARGEIRGGRFVERFGGEQYALPEAVGRLRAVRREKATGEEIVVSGADPLNLVGILTPEARVPSTAGARILYRDGQPVATAFGGKVSHLVAVAPEARWAIARALDRAPSTENADAATSDGAPDSALPGEARTVAGEDRTSQGATPDSPGS